MKILIAVTMLFNVGCATILVVEKPHRDVEYILSDDYCKVHIEDWACDNVEDVEEE